MNLLAGPGTENVSFCAANLRLLAYDGVYHIGDNEDRLQIYDPAFR
jgi:hypothetical protein